MYNDPSLNPVLYSGGKNRTWEKQETCEAKKHIIIFRFSALGDVAIAAPVVRAAACQIRTINSQGLKAGYGTPFSGIPNLTFWPAELEGKHKGIEAC